MQSRRYCHKMRIFARHNWKTMDRPSKRHIIFLVATLVGLLALGNCQRKPQTITERIDHLKQQIVADSTALNHLESSDFPILSEDFRRCDSALQHLSPDQVETVFESLNLTNAYLRQFSEVGPDMHQKMRYSLLQLDRLKSDVESQYLSDSLATVFLETETQVADTLHNRVAYFQDKFAYCRKELAAIKKKQH